MEKSAAITMVHAPSGIAFISGARRLANVAWCCQGGAGRDLHYFDGRMQTQWHYSPPLVYYPIHTAQFTLTIETSLKQ